MPAYSVTGTGVEWSDALVKEAAEACGCSAATQARPNPKRIKFTVKMALSPTAALTPRPWDADDECYWRAFLARQPSMA